MDPVDELLSARLLSDRLREYNQSRHLIVLVFRMSEFQSIDLVSLPGRSSADMPGENPLS